MTAIAQPHAVTISDAIVCVSGNFPLRRIGNCPTCKRRRRVAGRDLGAWAYVLWTCCGCGEQWGDGQMMERPFKRGWRKENVARAAETWREAGRYSRADHHAWLDAQIRGGD